MSKNPVHRWPVIGVLGSGRHAYEELARPLGRYLAGLEAHLLCGGGGGVMASVAQHYKASHPRGLVLGILPCHKQEPERSPDGYPNDYVDIAVRTHLPARGADGGDPGSRNHIVVLSSDVIVALPGGPGTRSELELAQRYRKPAILWHGQLDPLVELPPEMALTSTLAELRRFVQDTLARRRGMR